jgi:transient-receptor-potential-like protein
VLFFCSIPDTTRDLKKIKILIVSQECKAEYLELRRQAQKFAVDLLDQSRSSQELAIILNHDPDEPGFVEGDHMKLAKLELAIDFKQKKVISIIPNT